MRFAGRAMIAILFLTACEEARDRAIVPVVEREPEAAPPAAGVGVVLEELAAPSAPGRIIYDPPVDLTLPTGPADTAGVSHDTTVARR